MLNNNFARVAMLVAAASFVSGCVTARTHDRTVSELNQSRRSAADREASLTQQIASLNEAIDSLREMLTLARVQLAKASEDRDITRELYADSTALVAMLKQRLESLGQNVERLISDRGELATALENAKLRLQELARQTAALEAQATTFREVAQKLHGMIDAGQAQVVVREGRMMIVLPSDVLFDSGRANVRADAQQVLTRVAAVMSGIKDRQFLVMGYTDDLPIRTARFPSNWELSAARAIAVARVLIDRGVDANVLGIGGRGEHAPLFGNNSGAGRALNRRIEIVLEPNLSELPTLQVPRDGRGQAAAFSPATR